MVRFSRSHFISMKHKGNPQACLQQQQHRWYSRLMSIKGKYQLIQEPSLRYKIIANAHCQKLTRSINIKWRAQYTQMYNNFKVKQKQWIYCLAVVNLTWSFTFVKIIPYLFHHEIISIMILHWFVLRLLLNFVHGPLFLPPLSPSSLLSPFILLNTTVLVYPTRPKMNNFIIQQ